MLSFGIDSNAWLLAEMLKACKAVHVLQRDGMGSGYVDSSININSNPWLLAEMLKACKVSMCYSDMERCPVEYILSTEISVWLLAEMLKALKVSILCSDIECCSSQVILYIGLSPGINKHLSKSRVPIGGGNVQHGLTFIILNINVANLLKYSQGI